ncbi:MAG: bifunctional nuclease family protein [Anaerolineaceae bacterium]|nr:bifunctional nuclease family protein [Anaerolineaceae bacterium]
MSKMIEVVIDSVRVSLTNQQRIIILRDVNQERYLPIWIGAYEAEAITISLQEIELARPQTHDLVKNIMTKLNARLLRVEVVELQDDVFYGNLVIESNGNQINIDSRSSDAFALAVRMHVPILVADEIMESAGIIPERDLQGEEPSSIEFEDSQPASNQEPAGKNRLSVFEDYLKNLEIDEPPDLPGEDDIEPDEDKPDLNPG